MIYTSDVYLYSDKLPVTLKTKHCVIQLLFPYSFNHVKSEKRMHCFTRSARRPTFLLQYSNPNL